MATIYLAGPANYPLVVLDGKRMFWYVIGCLQTKIICQFVPWENLMRSEYFLYEGNMLLSVMKQIISCTH